MEKDSLEKVLITAALPYVNGPPHLGHIVGSHLPADIFARFKRMCGKKVLFLGGTDEHGTPIEITAQNHIFALDENSLKDSGFTVTHINLNDGTVEGIEHQEYPIFSVQYHPEASPGPHDSFYLFKEFYEMMEKNKI